VWLFSGISSEIFSPRRGVAALNLLSFSSLLFGSAPRPGLGEEIRECEIQRTIKAMAATAQIAWDWASALLSPAWIVPSSKRRDFRVALGSWVRMPFSSITVPINPISLGKVRRYAHRSVTRARLGIAACPLRQSEARFPAFEFPMPASTRPQLSRPDSPVGAGWVAGLLLNWFRSLATGLHLQRRGRPYWIAR